MSSDLFQVSNEPYHSINNYFTISPESPNGENVVYTRFFTVPTRAKAGRAHEQLADAELRLLNRESGEDRALSGVIKTEAHHAMSQTWLDDDTIAYYDALREELHVLTISTGRETVFPGLHVSHYSPVTDRIVFSSQGTKEFPVKGVYSTDRRGNVSLLARVEQIERFCPLGARGQNPYDPESWMITHPYWSPDGRKITFLTRIRAGEAYIHLMDPDGSNLRPWSRIVPRPMHYFWFDSDSVYGHDHADGGDKCLRRYDLSGNVIETLSGPGCHGTVSPDKNWIVTEDWYQSDPTNLYLYRRGDTTPRRIIVTQNAHWKHSDMHAVFSPDGKRVYFNYHVPETDQARVYCHSLDTVSLGE